MYGVSSSAVTCQGDLLCCAGVGRSSTVSLLLFLLSGLRDSCVSTQGDLPWRKLGCWSLEGWAWQSFFSLQLCGSDSVLCWALMLGGSWQLVTATLQVL